MRKRSAITATLVALTLALGLPRAAAEELPVAAPAEVGLSAEKLAAVDAAVEQLIAEGKIVGGLVAVARHGKVCHVAAFGQADTEPAEPMTPDTIFRIYSMTKPIVSAAALILVDRGTIALDDPVTKYIPELDGLEVLQDGERIPQTKPITIADLMLHTAGFSYGFGDDAIDQLYHQHQPLGADGLTDFAKRLQPIPLRFQPGDDWAYSVSIDVLGLVIQRASGQPLDAFLDEHVFKPLDMKDTGFFCPPDEIDRFAALYNTTDHGLERGKPNAWGGGFDKKPKLLSGGGGLVSTARDYLRFLMMVRNDGELFGQRILKPETARLMKTDQLPAKAFPVAFEEDHVGVGFGFGFSVRVSADPDSPHSPVGRYGWSGAASTHAHVSPQHDLILITLEQRRPFTMETMETVQPLVYDAIE